MTDAELPGFGKAALERAAQPRILGSAGPFRGSVAGGEDGIAGRTGHVRSGIAPQ